MKLCKQNLRTAPPHYQELLNRITRLIGLKHTIGLFEAPIEKPCTTHIYKGLPIITYNPKFLVRANDEGKWVVVAAFAREAIKHFNKDLFGRYLSEYYKVKFNRKPFDRINADYFMGAALRYEGATINEAMSIFSLFETNCSENDREFEEMKEALSDGWFDANHKLGPIKKALTPLEEDIEIVKEPKDTKALVAALAFGLLFALLMKE